MDRNRLARVPVALTLLMICIFPALAAEPINTPADSPKSFRSSLLTEQNIDRSRSDFSQCLEAAEEVRLAEKAYSSVKGSITELLQAERNLTAAQIHYLTTTNSVRGNPAMRDYLARRGEVSALERGLASTMTRTGKASDGDLTQVREEAKRYQEALKEARRELLRAEYAWKTASRADQLRYLNRKADRR